MVDVPVDDSMPGTKSDQPKPIHHRLRASEVIRDRSSGQPLGWNSEDVVDEAGTVENGTVDNDSIGNGRIDVGSERQNKIKLAQGDTLAWLWATLQIMVPILLVLTAVIAGGAWVLSWWFFR